MAKHEISVDTMYLLFEEIRAEINKLSKSSENSQSGRVTVDLSSIEDRLEGLQEQLYKLTDKTSDTTLLAELQDIKKKINSIPQLTKGITTGETERLLENSQKTLLQAIHNSAKKTEIVKYKLSTWKLYSILIVFLILVCTAGYYAERYYGMKKDKEFFEHYYVRYRYLQARKKTTTKADLEWLNKAPTDSIYNLTLVLEENRANKKEQNK